MSLIFRHASEEDAPAVHALIQLAFGEYVGMVPVPPGALSDTLEDTLRVVREGQTILLSVGEPGQKDGRPDYSNTELVGTARYELRPDYLYVGRVAVHPDYRRQGIGAMLMKHLEGIAPSLGYTRLYLGTRASMPGNIAFYERLGYTIVKQEPHPRGPDVIVWFEKRLTDVDTRETLLGALVEQLRDLPGLQIESVWYSFLSYEAGDPEYADLDVPLVYLGSEVELRFDGVGSRFLSWGSNRGWGGGMAFSLRASPQSHYTPGGLHTIDASRNSLWQSYLDSPIASVDVLGWNGVPNVCRFAFDTGSVYVGTGHKYTFGGGDDLLIASEEGWQSQSLDMVQTLAHLEAAP